VNSIAEGIEWILKAENQDELSENARSKVLREFDSRIVAMKHIDLYTEIVN
jgi:glycosyltransferase involved in cell wall biosynthesis